MGGPDFSGIEGCEKVEPEASKKIWTCDGSLAEVPLVQHSLPQMICPVFARASALHTHMGNAERLLCTREQLQGAAEEQLGDSFRHEIVIVGGGGGVCLESPSPVSTFSPMNWVCPKWGRN